MKSKTADITAKYQKMIDNIQWHLKTNKPTDKMELQKLYQQINDYREMIVDLETVAQFQRHVPDEAGEVYVWVKASDRLPDAKKYSDDATVIFKNIKTDSCHSINPYNNHDGYYLVFNPIGEWEWLEKKLVSPAPPSGEDAGKGIGDLKQDLFDFFLWFRENGDLYIDKSIENMISIYIKTTHTNV